MNSINRTLFIPLYGKAYVSRKGLFLDDPLAERIWGENQFPLKGKARSKWLAYYLGIRAAVFDAWLNQKMREMPDAVVLHIGCGLDSRVQRVGAQGHDWYDVDMPEVIRHRRRFYPESENYHMIAGELPHLPWLSSVPRKSCIVIMEGVSMYLRGEDLQDFVRALSRQFDEIALLMDCYTPLAAKLSRFRNPVREVGVTKVYGLEHPQVLNVDGVHFVQEHPMTPQRFIDELRGTEKAIFEKLYAGRFSQKLYRLYEYKKG